MSLIYCILFFLSILPSSVYAIRVLSAFKTVPERAEHRVSSVFIGHLTLDTSIPCTFQPIAYVTLDSAWDTRQVLAPRQDIAVLLPLPYDPDIFCQDINAHGQYILTAQESGLGLLINGPAWGDGYSLSALITGDFLGAEEINVGTFRFLFGLARINFPTGSFFFGQVWHPLIVPDCFPQTVSFNNGAPFEPRTRSPQLRYFQRWGSWDFMVVAASQGSYISPGPIGPSYTYFTNSVRPDFCVAMRKHFGEHQVGAAADFKRLVPRLVSNKNVKVNEYVDSAIVQAWATFNFTSSSVRMKVIYAQNAADHLMLSGYAVRTIDPITDARTYSPTACINGWIDTSYVLPSKVSELGLFVAVGKNLGSSHRLVLDSTGTPIVYPSTAIDADVDIAWRVAPRFVWTQDPLRFGLELEVTGASYGKLDAFARARNAIGVVNYRILACLYYVF